jgi:hypothetical protein
MSQTAEDVLTKSFMMPFKSVYSEPVDKPNHLSVWLAPDFLDHTVAKYLTQGGVEYVGPGDQPPRSILPIGVVPKASIKEPWRMIDDMRSENCNMEDWPSTMRGIFASRDIFSPGCFSFQCDIKQGYNNIGLRGCLPRIVEIYSGSRRSGQPKFTVHMSRDLF